MAARNYPFSYDPEKHKIVAAALDNQGNTSAFIRACIVFYETYKDKELPGDEITRRLDAIEEAIKNGLVIARPEPQTEEDEAFDDLLGQFD